MAASIPLATARQLVIDSTGPLESEPVELAHSLGRTVAADVRSPIAMPPFANSAMDGFALRSADTREASEQVPALLRLSGESRAGTPSGEQLLEGEIAGVSTGAALPAGADCVLRVEDSHSGPDGMIAVSQPIAPGTDVRPAGDDIEQDDLVIPAGSPIASGEVAMLAASGFAEIGCLRRPRVAIVTTGDELVPPGEPLAHGQIHDSNSAMIAALVLEHGGKLISVNRGVGDNREVTTAAIRDALAGAGDPPDVLVCCGGVSVGRHDHVKGALEANGAEALFWQVAMRPGHPTWFGLKDERPLIFGLPGNPVSAWVTFQMFVAPALRAMVGRTPLPVPVDATLAEALRKPAGNSMVLRCGLSRDPASGELVATRSSTNQRSHAISSLVGVDGLAILDATSENPTAGSRVAVELITSQTLET
jgi:molybdopterin molybdotransferase